MAVLGGGQAEIEWSGCLGLGGASRSGRRLPRSHEAKMRVVHLASILLLVLEHAGLMGSPLIFVGGATQGSISVLAFVWGEHCIQPTAQRELGQLTILRPRRHSS